MTTLNDLMKMDVTTLDFSEHNKTLNEIIDDYNAQTDLIAKEAFTGQEPITLKATQVSWLVFLASSTLDYIASTQALAALSKAVKEKQEEVKKPFDFNAPVTSEAQFVEGLKALFGDDAFNF